MEAAGSKYNASGMWRGRPAPSVLFLRVKGQNQSGRFAEPHQRGPGALRAVRGQELQPLHDLRDRVRRLVGKGKPDRPPRSQWTDNLLERSGVGAGTESCFACQGRIANLGAIAVATDENDKRTFSVWRCRTCGGFYLNDWTDRWERLDNLETEERYFRLAPGEALQILALINSIDGPEHPANRHQRTAQRRTLESFIADRAPLSHQIRQGR